MKSSNIGTGNTQFLFLKQAKLPGKIPFYCFDIANKRKGFFIFYLRFF